MDNAMLAKQTYERFCDYLTSRDWKFTRHDEDLVITCGARGEDLPMDLIIMVREKQQVISLLSPMPFKMAEDKRIDGALAVCVANNGLVNGCFDYDIEDGEIRFRLVTSFRGTELTEDVFEYMLLVSAGTIDDYNDKFLMISKGMITIEQFIKSETESNG